MNKSATLCSLAFLLAALSAVNTDDILDAAEYCANLLETAQMVPTREPPSAKILQWRSQPANQRDAEAIRKFALELSQTMEKQCSTM